MACQVVKAAVRAYLEVVPAFAVISQAFPSKVILTLVGPSVAIGRACLGVVPASIVSQAFQVIIKASFLKVTDRAWFVKVNPSVISRAFPFEVDLASTGQGTEPVGSVKAYRW